VTGKTSVTRDGLVIKEWQRTPKQLIQEWCKAQGRPPPRYVNSGGASSKPGQVLVRIVLADPKVKEKDVSLVPRDGFPDTVQAEHAVALLALQRVDAARNHEAKLPEPYRSTWLKLVGRTGAASALAAGDSGSDDGVADEEPFKCAECGKAFSKEHGLEAHAKKEHPKKKHAADFAFPAFPGAPAVPLPQPQAATAPPLMAQTAQTLPASSALLSAAAQVASAAASVAQASLSGLAAKGHFASEHEQRLAAEEAERFQAMERRQAEERAFREAEETCHVFMSAENRDAIETVVRRAAERTATGLAAFATTTTTAANEGVVDELVRLGFAPEDARLGASAGRDVPQALDWLCVHLPEDALPAGGGFDTARFHVGVVANKPAAAVTAVEQPPFDEDGLIDWVQRLVDPSYTAPLPALDAGAAAAPGDDNEALADELASLEAICGDAVAHSPGRALHVVRFALDAGCFGPGEAVLEVRVARRSYPASPHTIALVRNPRLGAELQAKISIRLAARALELVGEPLCYALLDFCKSHVDVHALARADLALLRSAIATPGLPTRPPKFNAVPAPHATASASTTTTTPTARPALRRRADMEAQSALLTKRFDALRRTPAFQAKLQARARLPAHAFRGQILAALDKHRALLVAGATGCGKTTQVPQFILEDAIERGQGGFVHIVVCQPRRLAATSVAARVASEMGEDAVGDLVGYRVQLDACAGSTTRLEFVTTGLLLRRLQTDPTLCNATHVVVDEVHERSIDSDFLLACLRAIARADLKIILMSATMDLVKLAAYFDRPPVLEIPGFTHPVTDVHLEELLVAVDYTPRGCARTDDVARKVQAVERAEGHVDYELLVRVVLHAGAALAQHGDETGSILVFLSGVAEIGKVARMLREEKLPMDVMALHGALAPAEQRKVFLPCAKGRRKVVLSTNVAETSVTIDDVVYVVDTGRVKETRFDAASALSSLVDTMVSRASAKQRRGRAGRVRPGVCARLWSAAKPMEDAQTPEVHRVPLEQTALQVLALGLGPVVKFMDALIDAPRASATRAALDALLQIGAVARDERTQEERLTALGKHLAQLPVDVRVGKMLVYGSVLGCLDAVLTVAAAHSRRSPWLNVAPERRAEAEQARRVFRNDGALSDHLVLVAAFNAWAARSSERERRAFCEEHFLSHDGLRDMAELRRDYLSALGKLGFSVGADAGASADVDDERKTRQLVKAVLVAGLYPRVVRVRRVRMRFVETASGSVLEEPEAKDLLFVDEASMRRVFVHPSSVLFHQRHFTFPFVVYSEMMQTSKTFVKDLTCVAPYGFLLFGGSIRVEHASGTVFVDHKYKFKCGARIGVLIKELRALLDALLEAKIVNPALDVASSDVVFAVKKLVEGDGLF